MGRIASRVICIEGMVQIFIPEGASGQVAHSGNDEALRGVLMGMEPGGL